MSTNSSLSQIKSPNDMENQVFQKAKSRVSRKNTLILSYDYNLLFFFVDACQNVLFIPSSNLIIYVVFLQFIICESVEINSNSKLAFVKFSRLPIGETLILYFLRFFDVKIILLIFKM